MKSIQGLVLENDPNYITCHINEFSEELKTCIKNHLSNICHGRHLAAQGLSAHNFLNTLQTFRNRYENKTVQQKKGIMGELLSHVLIHEFFDDFEVISPFFNMEEKSQRKGFDLLLTSKGDNEVWITEVKSGELSNTFTTPDSAINGFLNTAKRDLNTRLNQAEETFWLNAINAANLAMSGCNDYKNAINTILSTQATAATAGTINSLDSNVILISVLFHDTNDGFDTNITKNLSQSVDQENIFKNVITFSIQKEAYQNIENFLFQES